MAAVVARGDEAEREIAASGRARAHAQRVEPLDAVPSDAEPKAGGGGRQVRHLACPRVAGGAVAIGQWNIREPHIAHACLAGDVDDGQRDPERQAHNPEARQAEDRIAPQ